jgi:hypothetical protein
MRNLWWASKLLEYGKHIICLERNFCKDRLKIFQVYKV